MSAESTAETKACPFCHQQIRTAAIKCRHCMRYIDGRRQNSSNDVTSLDRMLVPVGRPISAILAGYLALFGIMPVCGLPFAIGALVCGLIALKAIKKDPDLSGSGRAWFGVILGGLMTLISMVALVFTVYLHVFTPFPNGGRL